MHVFIDTNILLDFYGATNKIMFDVSKIAVLAGRGNITIHLPQQVEDEFWRDRERTLKDALGTNNESKDKPEFPDKIKNFKDFFTKLNGKDEKFKMTYQKEIKAINKFIDKKKLLADSKFTYFFEVAKKIERTPDILSRARDRVEAGNPPGKENNLCDAIIWESLLESVPAYKYFVIISKDGHYLSDLNKDELKDFLQNEWKQKKRSVPQVYRTASDFIAKCFSNLDSDQFFVKADLIEKLFDLETSEAVIDCLKQLSGCDYSIYKELPEIMKQLIIQALTKRDDLSEVIEDKDVVEFLKKKVFTGHYDKERLIDRFFGGVPPSTFEEFLKKTFVEIKKMEDNDEGEKLHLGDELASLSESVEIISCLKELSWYEFPAGDKISDRLRHDILMTVARNEHCLEIVKDKKVEEFLKEKILIGDAKKNLNLFGGSLERYFLAGQKGKIGAEES